jgi:NTE family protein
MLFHVGALWRLNELAYLPKIDRFSSVSGGSITAGVLAMNWNRLAFDGQGIARDFIPNLVEPVRRLAAHTIDVRSILTGVFGPRSIGDQITAAYRRHLFGDTRLDQLPPKPRFVFNATNLQSGVLWRFSQKYMADYKVGMIENPTISLATAVAASAAFPPVLSPIILRPKMDDYRPAQDEPLHSEPYMTRVTLSDGGVYDNLGLETAWKRFKTVLVSDGGGMLGADATIPADWVRHGKRVIDVIGSQVTSLRKRLVIDSFEAGVRKGAYWGAFTDIARYKLHDALPCPHDLTSRLARLDTRLRKLNSVTQERLINWGYAVCDAAMRRWVVAGGSPPPGFPYAGGVG